LELLKFIPILNPSPLKFKTNFCSITSPQLKYHSEQQLGGLKGAGRPTTGGVADRKERERNSPWQLRYVSIKVSVLSFYGSDQSCLTQVNEGKYVYFFLHRDIILPELTVEETLQQKFQFSSALLSESDYHVKIMA